MRKFTNRPVLEPKYLTTRYTDENGCVLCDNKKNQDGYMRVRLNDGEKVRSVMLHVWEWQKVNGKKPEGMELNHLCKNRACCNVDHLELICGSSHATLTNINRVGYIMRRKSDDVLSEIYEMVKYKGMSINRACIEYDIKRSTLSSIMNKRSRTDVTNKVDKKYAQPIDTTPQT